ncbi:amidohydrolase [Jatrophihabitans fulvus]
MTRPAPADRPLLLKGGRVRTPSGGPPASAVLVADGHIAWVGDDDAAPAAATTVSLHGALVTPAFVDAHVHTTDTGLARTALDLRGARSLREALDAVERAARASRGRPVLGGGWNESTWPEGRPPTAAELDRAAYGGLVYLARVDIHSAVASSSLLAAVPGVAGLDGNRGDGWVGEPDAHDAVRRAALGAVMPAQRREAQRAALRHAASVGIASLHEMAGPVISNEADLAELLELAATEDVPEVIGYWGELGGVETALRLGAIGAAGDLFCDGSLGSGTAALHEPFADRPGTGWVRFEVGELAEHIAACVAAGLQAGFHAIGDAAVDQVLDAFALAGRRLGRRVGPGHRVEHAEAVRDPDRFAASGLTASMQPVFDALWGGEHGMYAQRLGPRRALGLNRVGDLHRRGVPLAFGSDSPVTELGPWAAVRAAATHHDPGASMSVAAAFAAHTAGGRAAAGRPAHDVVTVGAPADLAVWEGAGELRDGLPELADAELPRCVRTLRAGRTVFAADPD